jgi:hypothetical protein
VDLRPELFNVTFESNQLQILGKLMNGMGKFEGSHRDLIELFSQKFLVNSFIRTEGNLIQNIDRDSKGTISWSLKSRQVCSRFRWASSTPEDSATNIQILKLVVCILLLS